MNPDRPGAVPTAGSDGQVDVIVPAALDGERIDRAVATVTGLTRSAVADLIASGSVLVDGRAVVARSRAVVAGQRLQLTVPGGGPPAIEPDPHVMFGVVFEDPWLIVVDKPAGLVVHHGAGHRTGTLVDGLVARYPELLELPRVGAGDPDRPGIVHRLDKGTSGLLVVARTPEAFRHLSAQMRDHTAERRYLALVLGNVEADAGVVDAPVGRSARHPTRMVVSSTGKPARTRYRVLARYREPLPLTLVEATLDTGRTHQVRVHLAAIGHPVIGDDRDGSPRARPRALEPVLVAGRLFLHARRLSVDHPEGGRRSWRAPTPSDLHAVLRRLA